MRAMLMGAKKQEVCARLQSDVAPGAVGEFDELAPRGIRVESAFLGLSYDDYD
jgi:hypothetical protein